MKKILLIIRREYLTRVRQRSFLIMTILGPLLMAAIVIVPYYLATMDTATKTIAVIDETTLFKGKFVNSDNLRFQYLETDIWTAKEMFGKSGEDLLLYIPKTDMAVPANAVIYSGSQVNINIRAYIRNTMAKRIEDLKLESQLQEIMHGQPVPVNIDDLLRSIKSSVNVSTIRIDAKGNEEQSYPEVYIVLAMTGAILIYFFIFLFGSQVMRGVIEEKSNRIVEVIVSSVKPFQLMMGKILGVALVGLTQFLLWVILTFIIITAVTGSLSPAMDSQPLMQQVQDQETNAILDAIQSINFPVMIGSFLFFFLFGYLMYAALFAAIGGAVDSEADTQQFMLPITVPLILSIVVSQYIIQEPDGTLAIWLSMIPFTSPVVMMIRIPYGVPYLEIAFSMLLLILGFLATTWMAGKIYRTGILMYGKKISYREIWKWLRYK